MFQMVQMLKFDFLFQKIESWPAKKGFVTAELFSSLLVVVANQL